MNPINRRYSFLLLFLLILIIFILYLEKSGTDIKNTIEVNHVKPVAIKKSGTEIKETIEVNHVEPIATKKPGTEIKKTIEVNHVTPVANKKPKDRKEPAVGSNHFTPEQVQKFSNGFTVQDDPGLVKFIKEKWILEPPGKPININMSKDADHSQKGQSIVIDELLGHRENGFFVECGAADGEYLSNTLYFELKRKWTGLLIEANSDSYKKLIKKNRNAYLSNTCLSASNATGTFKFRPAGLIGGLDGKMDGVHEQWLKDHGQFKPESLTQCFNLYSLMLAVGVTKIDYFSLDIEGPELEVLKAIPLDKLYIDIITVEYRSWGGTIYIPGSLERLAAFREFFHSTGLYDEVAIIPTYPKDTQKRVEEVGLDVVFKRKQ